MATATLTEIQIPTTKSKSQQAIADATEKLIRQLEAGNSSALKSYLSTVAKFHNYSFGNLMLIGNQRPDATHVAGFHKWIELKRYVRKGEKGIMILAPLIKKTKDEEKDGPQIVGFRAVYVFDISQTDGEPLPTIEHAVTGDTGDAATRLVTFAASKGITVERSDSILPALGMSYGGRITLAPGQHPAEELTTLIHELAHELLHKGDLRKRTTKTVRETEAEAVSFIVAQAIGLDCGNSSADYIGLYDGNAETLAESLKFVTVAAQDILAAIELED